MPVIRIGNYQAAKPYVSVTNVEVNRRLWRNDVRLRLWRAIKKIEVPGLEERGSVTFAFDSEWDPAWESADESEAADPKIAYVFLEGFEDREDRPSEMRLAMAHAIGKALVVLLAEGWKVEVMPKRYNSEREGAIMVSLEDEASQS